MANYKLVDADQLDADLKTVADAIREKGGTTDELAFPDGMASAVEAIQAGGGDARMKEFIEGTLTELYDADATRIGAYAFVSNQFIKKISAPNVVEIKDNAFQSSLIQEMHFPKLKIVGKNAFYQCNNFSQIKFPLVEEIAYSSFGSVHKLVRAELPMLVSSGTGSCFYSSQKLKDVDCGNLQEIKNAMFFGCLSLRSVVIRRNSVCNLSNTNAFNNCHHFHGTVHNTYNPDGLKDGYIYVPRALIEDYKVATNWTTLADQFRALEDYTVDGTTTGAMDWDKINGGAAQ